MKVLFQGFNPDSFMYFRSWPALINFKEWDRGREGERGGGRERERKRERLIRGRIGHNKSYELEVTA